MMPIAPNSSRQMEQPRLALLIDSDNAQASQIEQVLGQVEKLGNPIIKRIYGDFTDSANNKWKKILHQYAIQPVQQFAYTTGKNSTDFSMIIDAMDLLYSQKIDGFCLVSSDSDFTSIAMRIKEDGLMVYGFGKKTTPSAFRCACSDFFFVDECKPETSSLLNAASPILPASLNRKIDGFLSSEQLLHAFNTSEKGRCSVELGAFGSVLAQLYPWFKIKKSHYKKVSTLIEAFPDLFELVEIDASNLTRRYKVVLKTPSEINTPVISSNDSLVA